MAQIRPNKQLKLLGWLTINICNRVTVDKLYNFLLSGKFNRTPVRIHRLCSLTRVSIERPELPICKLHNRQFCKNLFNMFLGTFKIFNILRPDVKTVLALCNNGYCLVTEVMGTDMWICNSVHWINLPCFFSYLKTDPNNCR